MTEWISIQDSGFVAADVIRWKESIFKPRRSKKAKAVRLGNYIMTAEVLNAADARDWAGATSFLIVA